MLELAEVMVALIVVVSVGLTDPVDRVLHGLLSAMIMLSTLVMQRATTVSQKRTVMAALNATSMLFLASWYMRKAEPQIRRRHRRTHLGGALAYYNDDDTAAELARNYVLTHEPILTSDSSAKAAQRYMLAHLVDTPSYVLNVTTGHQLRVGTTLYNTNNKELWYLSPGLALYAHYTLNKTFGANMTLYEIKLSEKISGESNEYVEVKKKTGDIPLVQDASKSETYPGLYYFKISSQTRATVTAHNLTRAQNYDDLKIAFDRQLGIVGRRTHSILRKPVLDRKKEVEYGGIDVGILSLMFGIEKALIGSEEDRKTRTLLAEAIAENERLETEKTRIATDLNTVQSEYNAADAKHQSDLARLTSELGTVTAAKSAAEADAARLSADLAAAISGKKTVESEKAVLATELAAVTTAKGAAESDAARLAADLAAVKSLMSATVADRDRLAIEVAAVTTAKDGAEAETARLAAELAAFRGTTSGEKTVLESKIAGLEADAAALERKLADLEAANAALETKHAGLEAEKADLEKKHADVETEKAALEQKHAALEEEIKLLRDEQVVTEAKAADLEKELATIRSTQASLETENVRLADEIAAAKLAQDTYRATAEAEKKRLEDELDAVRSAKDAAALEAQTKERDLVAAQEAEKKRLEDELDAVRSAKDAAALQAQTKERDMVAAQEAEKKRLEDELAAVRSAKDAAAIEAQTKEQDMGAARQTLQESLKKLEADMAVAIAEGRSTQVDLAKARNDSESRMKSAAVDDKDVEDAFRSQHTSSLHLEHTSSKSEISSWAVMFAGLIAMAGVLHASSYMSTIELEAYTTHADESKRVIACCLLLVLSNLTAHNGLFDEISTPIAWVVIVHISAVWSMHPSRSSPTTNLLARL